MKHWINYYLHWKKYGHFISISTRALKEKKIPLAEGVCSLKGPTFPPTSYNWKMDLIVFLWKKTC